MSLSLTNRLRIGFAVLVALLAAVSILGVGRLFQVRQDFEDESARLFEAQVQVERIRSAFVLEQSALVEARPKGRRAADFRRAEQVSAGAVENARSLAGDDPALVGLLDDRDSAEGAWRARVAVPVLAGRPPKAEVERSLVVGVAQSGEALTAGVEKARTVSRDDSLDETRRVVVLVAVGLLGALLAALFLFSGLVRSMRGPLRRLVEGARNLAGGDLSTRVEASGPAEVATLGQAFNDMASALERDARERDRIEHMKDDFLLTVSHELRTPVTSVKGFAELLAMQGKSLDAGQREAIDAITAGASDLSALIDDLVDLARSDAGRLRIEPKVTGVKALLDRVARQMRPQFTERGQSLTVSVARDTPKARIDPERIIQVLINLVANANKYGREGGAVRISAEREGRRIAIEVADDGPGLSEEEIDHVFERFWRADSGVTQRVGGSGLGLAIARSLVELHKGRITVHPNERGGQLPLHRAGLTCDDHQEALAESAHGSQPVTRVLVVDDSETVLLMLQRRLEFAGYEVSTATDGHEALAGAAADPGPDLILLDAMMPNMSGLEALRELRSAGDETPVIIVSAYRYGDEPEEALQMGANGCIGKPFDWDSLVGEIERLTKT